MRGLGATETQVRAIIVLAAFCAYLGLFLPSFLSAARAGAATTRNICPIFSPAITGF
jgi:hypothetical protein